MYKLWVWDIGQELPGMKCTSSTVPLDWNYKMTCSLVWRPLCVYGLCGVMWIYTSSLCRTLWGHSRPCQRMDAFDATQVMQYRLWHWDVGCGQDLPNLLLLCELHWLSAMACSLVWRPLCVPRTGQLSLYLLPLCLAGTFLLMLGFVSCSIFRTICLHIGANSFFGM